MLRFFDKTELFGPKWSGFWALQVCLGLHVAVFCSNTRVWLNMLRFWGETTVLHPKCYGFGPQQVRWRENGGVLWPHPYPFSRACQAARMGEGQSRRLKRGLRVGLRYDLRVSLSGPAKPQAWGEGRARRLDLAQTASVRGEAFHRVLLPFAFDCYAQNHSSAGRGECSYSCLLYRAV
jgi:hypothetical protein